MAHLLLEYRFCTQMFLAPILVVPLGRLISKYEFLLHPTHLLIDKQHLELHNASQQNLGQFATSTGDSDVCKANKEPNPWVPSGSLPG